MPDGKSASDILKTLRALAHPREKRGLERFGIFVDNSLGGISTPTLKQLARKIGKNHKLAEELWKSGIHEARHVAAFIDEPEKVTERQMERWAKEFDSWDVVDGCCLYLFHKTPFAHRKAMEWSTRKEEFVKRAAFSMMAVLAVHDKQAGDGRFIKFLPLIKRESTDERNFVKKAVNWALRQIGKRNLALNEAAITVAGQIREIDSRSARWIAADALRELRGAPIQARLRAAAGS
jgi:3-methyladenine DNA glycosylase AlkD